MWCIPAVGPLGLGTRFLKHLAQAPNKCRPFTLLYTTTTFAIPSQHKRHLAHLLAKQKKKVHIQYIFFRVSAPEVDDPLFPNFLEGTECMFHFNIIFLEAPIMKIEGEEACIFWDEVS